VTDTLLGLVAGYGVPLVFAFTFLSCIAVPVPTSLILLAAGAFAASGDLLLWQVGLAAYAGAVAGDQTGFGIGRLAESRVSAALARPERAAGAARARAAVERWGGIGVFLSRWLFSPLGPWVNLLAGAGGFRWPVFTVWAAAGEAVWVALYVGLGFAFASQIEALAVLLSNSAGLLAAALIAAALLAQLRARLRRQGARA
jgi:membrane protein DedA with SNARE-associated domain